jgi:phosphoribosylcarboxyaminoimidazole (NCAIR) mutase
LIYIAHQVYPLKINFQLKVVSAQPTASKLRGIAIKMKKRLCTVCLAGLAGFEFSDHQVRRDLV